MVEGEVSLTSAQLEAMHKRLDEITGSISDLQKARNVFRGVGWIRIFLSGVTAAMVGFFTPILAVAAVVDPPIPVTAWWIAAGGGVIALAKDLRSQLDLPPMPANGGIPLPKGKGGSP
jgi:hypothetical protein